MRTPITLKTTLALAVTIGGAPALATADPYADAVAEANIADSTCGGGDCFGEPEDALGAPDGVTGENRSGFLRLGDLGDLTLNFTDNVCLIDEGDDVRVVELGRAAIYLVDVGDQGGALSGVSVQGIGDDRLDLDPTGLLQFNQIKIVDGGDLDADGLGGADIDAVECLFSVDAGAFRKYNRGAGEIRLGHDAAQQFSYVIEVNNGSGMDGGLAGVVALDVLPGDFNLDAVAEDAVDGARDGVCEDGDDCDGVRVAVNGVVESNATAACMFAAWRPDGNAAEEKLQPEYISIDAAGLNDGETCEITVFAATDEIPASVRKTGLGDGSDPKETFAPGDCAALRDKTGDLILDDGDPAAPICDTVALNHGLKVFDRSTGRLLFGPKDSIQLTPIAD